MSTVRKKVAVLAWSMTSLAGVERVTSILCNELSKEYSINLILVCQDMFLSYQIDNRVEINCLYNVRKRQRYIFCVVIKRMIDLIKKKEIDCLIVMGRGNGVIPLLVKFFTNIQVVYCEHGTIKPMEAMKKSLVRGMIDWLTENMIAKMADKIVCLTNSNCEIYRILHGVPKDRLEAIYNPIEESLMNNDVAFNYKTKKIITVGRVVYEKGYEHLLKVAKNVLDKHPDWEWHIYGGVRDIEYFNYILSLIKQYGLVGKVIVKEEVNNIYDIYQDYSFYVMTSRHEGLPMVLLEAKAKKLPLVSFDINSGPSDIIRDGIDGYLVKPFDVDEMANKICDLIENQELRKRFSDNAYGNIDKFKKETIIKQWRELIDGV